MEFPEGGRGIVCGPFLENPEGWGGHMKNPFRGGGMDIFWNHTLMKNLKIGAYVESKFKATKFLSTVIEHKRPQQFGSSNVYD